MRIFGAGSMDNVLKKLGLKENESIDHPWINKAMERAQQKVEGRNFEVRKTLIKFDDVMNDQRQVIFSQRLKVLKNNNISETLNSFLDELLVTFVNSKDSFNKTNDKKEYLSSIKNVTGNIISDEELLNLTKLDQQQFKKKFTKLYENKKQERIKLVGENQNNDIEKKIFLQIIDFSWRSHLQYLEQLRQVIGLRSYGQKDPLSEFKKEAFNLFEGLLEKIKIEVIKFLLNINLVVNKEEKTEEKETKYNKVGRNDKCPCNSGKKFKHCHGSI